MRSQTVEAPAHQQSRRADAHLRAHRFEEAAECHRLAADLVAEAMNDTRQPRALESLTLQRQHHLRQTDVIRLRKSQYEKFQRAVENHKAKMLQQQQQQQKPLAGEDIDLEFPPANLPVAIFRTMEETDSLMHQLLQRGLDSNDDPALAVPQAERPMQERGSKQPKDEKQVVEELQTLTHHLHNLVIQLLTQLDESNQEKEALRTQNRILIAQLEATQNSSPPSSSQQAAAVTVTTPSSAPLSSPCAELSPDVTPTTSRPTSYHAVDRALPILAPLEMPQFDFSVFQKLDGKSPPDVAQ
ncbi:hypothetical protein B566_EDAN013224 [Ephemera danica]|nr:hypothetical protein B566_EDAN013224 [Ephemera danica]